MPKQTLEQLVNLLNTELYRLHKAGKSIKLGANGYFYKLQKNELVSLDISVNTCKHKWTACSGPVDIEEGGDEINFQWCKLCGMTEHNK